MATHTGEQLQLAADVVGAAVRQARATATGEPTPASAAVA
jgi:hypothetical protein